MDTERNDWTNEYDEGYDAFDADENGETAGAPDADGTAGACGAPSTDAQGADERLANLLENMPTRRKVLLAIIDRCREAIVSPELERAIDELQERNRSVFLPATLIGLLEQAGGLARVNADGSPLVRDAQGGGPKSDAGPDDEGAGVQETAGDGASAQNDDEGCEVEYLAVETAPQSYWVATAAGIAAVEADDPRSRLVRLLEDDAPLKPVYREIIEALADGELSKPQIDVIVKGNPLAADERHRAGYFIDRLEQADVIAWTGRWSLTDLGRAVLGDEALYN